MANLGFVGLGVMGGNMVARLLDKGHTVTGYNRTRTKAQWLIDRGMKWADSPRAVAGAADFTFSMVTNSAAINSITEGTDGILAGLGPGKLLIDMSTVSPAVIGMILPMPRFKMRSCETLSPAPPVVRFRFPPIFLACWKQP